LAGHRATTSVYATLGVAAATLLVVGGILAGPAVLECSRDPGGFGACLRDKVSDSGLIAPGTESLEQPSVVADISSEPEPPPTGWMEAAANEFELPVAGLVELAGTPANLLADVADTGGSEAVEVAVAPATELATTTPAQEQAPVSVALVGPDGALGADAAPVEDDATAVVELSQAPSGTLVADASSEPPPAELLAVAPIDQSGDLTSVVAPPSSEPAPVELSAEPVSSEPEPAPEPDAPSEPAIVVEFNPQYPNVLVLPPPAAGDNSSFRSLQLN
jgi:hypothetical protein